MSEFKFACPVCGQHITADSSATGSQLDCPTCFRKIVVPPSSTESKFVLSASEAGRPRTSPAPVDPLATPVLPRRMPLGMIILIGAFICLAVTGSLAFFHIGPFRKPIPPAPTNSVAKVEPPLRQIPSGTVPWSLELLNVDFPAETAFGRIRGKDFVCDRAVLQGGMLNFRMGRDWPPELGISIFLYARNAAELSGKSAFVTTNNIRSPRVLLRWKEGDQNRTLPFTNGFALKLEFGTVKGDRMPGKIYLCLPDEDQSCVAGVFNAEIRRPAPPKP